MLGGKGVILMDEPFSGLDPPAISRAIELIKEVAHLDEMNTVIVITHDVRAAAAVADTAWMMGRDRDEKGRIIHGARIQRTYDLIERGFAWVEGDVRRLPGFNDLVLEIEDAFPYM